MNTIPLFIPVLALAAALLIVFGRWISSEEKPDPLAISLRSKCPACGHLGCKLAFVFPQQIEVGEKRQIKQTEPMVERTCNTCGAKSYQKPVLDPKEWLA